MNKTLLLLATLGSVGVLAGPAAAGDYDRSQLRAPPSFGVRIFVHPAPKVVRHHHRGAWQLRPQPVFRFGDPRPIRQFGRPSPRPLFGHLPPRPHLGHFPPRPHFGHLPPRLHFGHLPAPPASGMGRRTRAGASHGSICPISPSARSIATIGGETPGATANGGGMPGRGAISPTGSGSTDPAITRGSRVAEGARSPPRRAWRPQALSARVRASGRDPAFRRAGSLPREGGGGYRGGVRRRRGWGGGCRGGGGGGGGGEGGGERCGGEGPGGDGVGGGGGGGGGRRLGGSAWGSGGRG